jgi:hypothetical protein
MSYSHMGLPYMSHTTLGVRVFPIAFLKPQIY